MSTSTIDLEENDEVKINVNEIVVLPYTTAQTYLLGIDHYHEIMIKTASPDAVSRAVRDIEDTLRQTHGITDPAKDDFFVVTVKDNSKFKNSDYKKVSTEKIKVESGKIYRIHGEHRASRYHKLYVTS